jgi:hypothetical protein
VAEQDPADMDIHWAPQHFLLSLDKVEYDFLGRFEFFRTHLESVIDVLGLDVPRELVEMRTAHVTGAQRRLHDYYDKEAVELVQRIYREDFHRLGYGRDLRFAT